MSDQGAGNRERNDRDRGGRRGGKRPFGKSRGRAEDRGKPEAGRPRPPHRDFAAQVVVPSPAFPTPDCPLCGKPINDIPSALAERASKQPAHFDCVLASLVEAEKPGPQERVIYLGSGAFAVVEGNPQTPQKFSIVRKIQYEDRDAKPDWRKDLNRAVVR